MESAEVHMRRNEAMNLCESGLMAHCTARSSWKEQTMCKYYRKATTANRCMYYYESLGGHCDCVEAQKNII